jgi:uncharacterized protein (TIGR03089 family)
VHQLTPAATPERQFERLLQREPARPFVTYYDEATGERSELSVKSLANWVAKTHHLLTGELGLGVGDTALVALPAHWISVPILIGCFTAGLAVTDRGPAEVAFVAPETLETAAGVDEVFAVAPASAAVGFRGDAPSPAADYVAAVRPQPDKWPSVHLAAGPDDPCLPGLSRAEVMGRAAAALPSQARLLTTRPWGGPGDWLDSVVAPLAVGGSVIFVVNAPDDTLVQRRAVQERATARL